MTIMFVKPFKKVCSLRTPDFGKICFTFLLVLFSLQPLEINIITSNYILQVAKLSAFCSFPKPCHEKLTPGFTLTSK